MPETKAATDQPSAEPVSAGVSPLDLDGRLIAEAARIYESRLEKGLDDGRATEIGRSTPGDLEHKIIARARNLPVAEAILSSLRQLRTVLRLTGLASLLLAGSAGALTALTALDAPAGQAVNFHWALLSLLGLETLVLLLWAALALLQPRGPVGPSFGLLLSSLSRRLAQGLSGRPGRDGPQAAALQAAATLTGRGAAARWSLSAVSHGIWLAFLAGALAMTLVTLSVKQVAFVWQTTILSEESYLPLTEALSVLPQLAGLPVPSRTEIEASRWRGPGELPTAASRSWAGLLIGSLVLYGLVPRALLLLLCLLLWRRAIRRLRLDLDRPAYQRLRERLMPSVRHEGVVGRDRTPPADPEDGLSEDELPVPTISFAGPVALIRLEIEAPPEGWPPGQGHLAGKDPDWRDLGAIESRADRDRVLTDIDAPPPGLILVAVSLLTTPDRGVGAFLQRLRSAARAPVALLLSEGAHLKDRLGSSDAKQRLADWRSLTARAGIPPEQAIRFDLARQDAADLERLSKLLGTGPR